jgi:hypothetical protein
MLAFLEFILATVGLTFIVTQSKLFKPVRDFFGRINGMLGYLLGCPMCFGLWSGLIVWTLQELSLDIVVYGFIGSFLSYVFYLLLSPLMKKYD